ncbi:MAG TPA: GGDEF domain-containing protein [Gemmatimonadales bacterium]|nr:GGDEF domain-containing protein [Gemmatimonadales bacterium]
MTPLPVVTAALGLVVGAAAGWWIGRRGARGRSGQAIADLQGDELLASESATYLAANLPVESSFPSLAMALVERAEARVGMPCALAMREKPGAPVRIVEVSPALDRRLKDRDVEIDSEAGRAVTEGIPVVGRSDVAAIKSLPGDRRRPLHGGIAVPVGQASAASGALLALGPAPGSTQQVVDQLSDLARRFAPVLVPAWNLQLANQKAETDELTGLPNRRRLIGAMQRHGSEACALVILDLDHFKRINDTFGHHVGDAALRHLARVLRETVRPSDLAARVGGEEFAVWLPGAQLATAREVAERVRERVAAAPFRADGVEQALTVSCGVTAFPVPTASKENLYQVADSMLYRAKREGRNRVVVFEAEGS